jgi:TonB-dependent receptor
MKFTMKSRLLGASALAMLALTPALAMAAGDDAATDVEALTVTSLRASEAKAVDGKRASNTIIDSIVATDVGKLPDQNVAEALRRLPAISVANDQGEGRYVIIRGVNPNLANVTVNGATAAVPEPEGRQIKLDDVPSSLIGKVDVIKSLTPDRDANAIAGQIDVDTLSAFDRNKPFLYARGAYGLYEMNKKHPYEGDATAGTTFGPDKAFGVVISGNYSKRPIESQNFGASGPTFITQGGFTIPNLEEFRDYNLIRERKGLTGNFDWRPNDSVKVYLRTLYSEFSDAETRDRFRIDNGSAYTNQTADSGTFKGRGIAYVRARTEDDNTASLLLGGEFKLPVGTLTAEIGHSRAEKDDPLRSEVQYRTGGSALTVNYKLDNALYLFTPSANFYDPASYTSFNSFNLDRRKAVDVLNQGRVDWKIPVSFSDAGELKFGLKVLDRKKTNDRGYETYSGGATPPPLTAVANTGAASVYDGRYQLGPRIDYAKFRAYIASNPTSLTYSLSGSLGNALVNDYEANEKVYAGYGMATLKYGDVTVIPGVRVETTKGDYSAKTITAASTMSQGYNAFGKFDYTDVFPDLNVRWDVNDRLVLRAGATTAIGRPNFSDLAPYVSVDTSGTGSAAIGNPNLQPLKSVNGDFALEYYLPNHGVASVSLFYKQIDNPIFTSIRTPRPGETFGTVTLPALAAITQPINANEAKVSGMEFNIQTQFSDLPAPFDGLGASANITFSNGSATGVAGRSGGVPLDRQSERTGSAQLLYEKYGFQARLAYSFRSKYLLVLGATPADDNVVDGYSSLDAHISYTWKQTTVFVEGSNLTDEPYRIFLGTADRVIENERYGATYRAGLQLAF